jgi:hypothetical protein
MGGLDLQHLLQVNRVLEPAWICVMAEPDAAVCRSGVLEMAAASK